MRFIQIPEFIVFMILLRCGQQACLTPSQVCNNEGCAFENGVCSDEVISKTKLLNGEAGPCVYQNVYTEEGIDYFQIWTLYSSSQSYKAWSGGYQIFNSYIYFSQLDKWNDEVNTTCPDQSQVPQGGGCSFNTLPCGDNCLLCQEFDCQQCKSGYLLQYNICVPEQTGDVYRGNLNSRIQDSQDLIGYRG